MQYEKSSNLTLTYLKVEETDLRASLQVSFDGRRD